MSDTHEVISSFLDDEPFDAKELADALSDPAGRTMVIDLVALRHIVQPDDRVAAVQREQRPRWRSLLAAAAVVIALVGGYFIGENRSVVETSDPPAPSRVVQAAEWQPLPNGGAR